MTDARCSSDAAPICAEPLRRAMVRVSDSLAGIDYIEVYPDRRSLCVHFFGRVPEGLGAGNVVIEGGDRIRDIKVLTAKFQQHADGDTCLRVTLDHTGDFSSYCLCIVAPRDEHTRCSYDTPEIRKPEPPDGIDPRYACASFSFRVDCAATLDCVPAPVVDTQERPLPAIDYLARDYPGFRRLMLDRLALTMPAWHERHVPDLQLTLVEQCAYIADQLSYYQDAVATEAYLGTARRRISVRRHARLVDYVLHEGCNARAWIAIESDRDLDLPARDLLFAAPPADVTLRSTRLSDWYELRDRTPSAALFEPVIADGATSITVRAAHSRMRFYTWQNALCCLPRGATRATLVDPGTPVQGADSKRDPWGGHALRPAAGDVLILEEIAGRTSGRSADADSTRRHAVRLVATYPTEDPLTGQRLVEVEWHRDDALPFELCLSTRTPPPDCEVVEVALARGNVLLVDHGTTRYEESDDWTVQVESTHARCICGSGAAEEVKVPKRLRIELSLAPVTHACAPPLPSDAASVALVGDPRSARPQIALDAAMPPNDGSSRYQWPSAYAWMAVPDLLSSEPDDAHFVVEFDDEGRAHIRFGGMDGGQLPQAGWRFRARCRVGNGSAGNVGADSIVWMAVRDTKIDGATLRVRNPLPAAGGADREPVEEPKRFAPHAFARKGPLVRAVSAEDYAAIADEDTRIAGACAELAWTGCWYEADVALDPVGTTEDSPELWSETTARLDAARRIGHELRIVKTHRVPLEIALDVCVETGVLRGEVERELRQLLSSRCLPGGRRGLFHPDELGFGDDVDLSNLLAAVQAVSGVAHVEASVFDRLDHSDPGAIARGFIRIGVDEIAQLDADPNFPEHGLLTLNMRGGR